MSNEGHGFGVQPGKKHDVINSTKFSLSGLFYVVFKEIVLGYFGKYASMLSRRERERKIDTTYVWQV